MFPLSIPGVYQYRVRRRLRLSPWAALYLSTAYSSLSFHFFRSLFQVFISTTSFTTFAVSRSLPQHRVQLAIFPCFPLSTSGRRLRLSPWAALYLSTACSSLSFHVFRSLFQVFISTTSFTTFAVSRSLPQHRLQLAIFPCFPFSIPGRRLRLSPWVALYLSTAFSSLSFHVFRSLFQVFISTTSFTTSFTTFAVSRSLPQNRLQLAIFPCFPFSISGVYQHDVVYDFRREPFSTSARPIARYLSMFSVLYFRCLSARRRLRLSPWAALYLSTAYSSLSFHVFRSLFQVFIITTSFTTFAVSRSLPQHRLQLAIFPFLRSLFQVFIITTSFTTFAVSRSLPQHRLQLAIFPFLRSLFQVFISTTSFTTFAVSRSVPQHRLQLAIFPFLRSLFQVFIITTSFTTFAVSRSLPQHRLQLAIFPCFPLSISGIHQYDVVYDFRREPLSTSAPPTARYLSIFTLSISGVYHHDVVYDFRREPLSTSAPPTARYLSMFSALYSRCLLVRRRLRRSPWAALYLSTAYSSLSFHVFRSLFQVYISTTSFTTFAVSRSLPQHVLQLAITLMSYFPLSISGFY